MQKVSANGQFAVVSLMKSPMKASWDIWNVSRKYQNSISFLLLQNAAKCCRMLQNAAKIHMIAAIGWFAAGKPLKLLVEVTCAQWDGWSVVGKYQHSLSY